MNVSTTTQRFRPRPRAWFGLGAGVVALALAGCDRLTDLNNPDIITGPVARDTANLPELANGAFFEFARALTGPAENNGTPGIIGLSGLMTDELWYSSTFPTMKEIDARNIDVTNSNLLTEYQYIQRARNLADRVADQYATAGQANTTNQATMQNLAGYSILFLAENFCSGVPLSSTSLTGDLVFGPQLTTAQLVDTAIARFDAALAGASAGGSADQQNLARIGKARALLINGDFAGAAAVVAPVPTSFVHEVEYSEIASGQNNGVFYNINSERRSSAGSGEGINGIVFFRRGPPPNTIDPRAPADSLGLGLGSLTVPLYRQNKYPTRGSPVPLATGIEARLIEAEAALNLGQSAAYLTTLNALRATQGLAPLTDPGTPQARVRQFFQERAFWLWLTGHRLADLRRMVKFYGFNQADVFPTGQTIFGTPYGSDVNFPIPFNERNNPEFTGGCFDRNA